MMETLRLPQKNKKPALPCSSCAVWKFKFKTRVSGICKIRLLSLSIKAAISALPAGFIFMAAPANPAESNIAIAKFVNLYRMRNSNILVKIVIFGLLLLAVSCSLPTKWKAANIFKQCKFSFEKVQIDSFTGDSLKFSIFLNARNNGKDSLFIQDLSGFMYLDSIFEIPFSLQNPRWISPGLNQIGFSGAVELNLFKLPALLKAEKFRMQGKAYVAVKPGQEAVAIGFDETRDIPQDIVQKTVKKLIGF